MSRPNRRPPPALHPLEPREVPAGVVAASLAGGVLTLTGDDAANIFTLQFTATTVTLTPDGLTTIDDRGTPGPGTPGAAVVLTGPAASLQAALNGGNDTVILFAGSDLVLAGPAVVDLGDGRNNLSWNTSGTIDLGALTVRCGDGRDVIVLAGGSAKGSRVRGTATIALGDGGVDANIQNVDFPGPAGLRVAAGEGFAQFLLNSVHVAGPLVATGGSGQTLLNLAGCTAGPVAVAAASAGVSLFGTTVAGGVTARGLRAAEVDLNAAAATGPVRVTATAPFGTSFFSAGQVCSAAGVTLRSVGNADLFVGPGARLTTAGDIVVASPAEDVHVTVVQGELDARNLSLSSGTRSASYDQRMNTTPDQSHLVLTGNLAIRAAEAAVINVSDGTTAAATVRLAGGKEADFSQSGTNALTAAGPLTVTTTGLLALLSAKGKSLTVGGDLAVAGPAVRTQTTLQTTGTSEVRGNAIVTGGPSTDTFTVAPTTRFKKDLRLALGGGANSVQLLGVSGSALGVDGNLSIATGAGDDAITMTRTAVTGAVRIAAGGGADTLTIDLGSKLLGPFAVDMGAGDDAIVMAQTTGAPAGVSIVGPTTIRTGSGNDTLILGKAVGSGGDPNTGVFFGPTGGTVDGGTGLNLFDGLTPNQAPAQFTGLSATDFLNWTDPNP